MTIEELAEMLKGQQARLNTEHEGAGAKLIGENFSLRAADTAQKAEIADLKTKLPAQGSVVLTPEQAQGFEAYKKLGTAEAVAATAAERDALKAAQAKSARRDLLDSAAAAHGFTPEVLRQLAGDGLGFELKDEQRDGKTVPVAYVKDGEKPAQALDVYAAAAWPKFMPSLKAESQPAGTRFPSQSSGGKPPANDVVAQVLAANARRADAPNSLKPAQPDKPGA